MILASLGERLHVQTICWGHQSREPQMTSASPGERVHAYAARITHPDSAVPPALLQAHAAARMTATFWEPSL